MVITLLVFVTILAFKTSKKLNIGLKTGMLSKKLLAQHTVLPLKSDIPNGQNDKFEKNKKSFLGFDLGSGLNLNTKFILKFCCTFLVFVNYFLNLCSF